MSAIINFSIRVDKLPKQNFVAGKDGAVFCNLTMSVDDKTRFGNNVGVYVSQTQEEREAKKKRTYVSNGKVVWTDNKIVLAEKEEQAEAVTQEAEVSDLPF